MLIDFRPHARLRAERPADLGAAVLPVVSALSDSTADLSRVRVVCDWVQYRSNFREAVDIRPILCSAASGAVPAALDALGAAWKWQSMSGVPPVCR